MNATPRSAADVWALTATERRSLADDLAAASPSQWAADSLCGDWSVEETLAHLTAAASIGPWRWMGSVLGARFDFDLHNRRRLNEQLGPDPAATLARFRAVLNSTTSTWGAAGMWLGEVIVHAQDIRRPLGITTQPSVAAATEVAQCYAQRDFTVPGLTNSQGLHLQADDGPFQAGEGPLVTGPTVALMMAMAGRAAYLEDLSGPGVSELNTRLAA
ncbi:maleylpyruvate isomerase family mycothiol-dependent enzyme [Kineosporia babensis]|uniref:Maleylpyruvate isomerase family mycothiol-dependent enzyme n=1 Tax=Kineosporia babensis TaxID=499548 RepID=A0A9X1NKE7_9ACTN|nr:maleylpyruvate isomerase family mycothiol-dependent enzyme [Kineosporia babensis]MCD5314796.1 maleylpyruvate isomerase family mycothiol-dependent enzyme [Kineosporia babensis]